jgi:hypothetical protein
MKNREGTKPISEKLKKDNNLNQQFSVFKKNEAGKKLKTEQDTSHDQDDELVCIRSTN